MFKRLIARARCVSRRIAREVLTDDADALKHKLAVQRKVNSDLHRRLEVLRQRDAEHTEEIAFLRAQLTRYDIRPAAEKPPCYGSYLVLLSGARVWHEAYWSSTGWRVLVQRGNTPVTHWRRMPPTPADRVLPYSPPAFDAEGQVVS